jgi:hypothetical protein
MAEIRNYTMNLSDRRCAALRAAPLNLLRRLAIAEVHRVVRFVDAAQIVNG